MKEQETRKNAEDLIGYLDFADIDWKNMAPDAFQEVNFFSENDSESHNTAEEDYDESLHARVNEVNGQIYMEEASLKMASLEIDKHEEDEKSDCIQPLKGRTQTIFQPSTLLVDSQNIEAGIEEEKAVPTKAGNLENPESEEDNCFKDLNHEMKPKISKNLESTLKANSKKYRENDTSSPIIKQDCIARQKTLHVILTNHKFQGFFCNANLNEASSLENQACLERDDEDVGPLSRVTVNQIKRSFKLFKKQNQKKKRSVCHHDNPYLSNVDEGCEENHSESDDKQDLLRKMLQKRPRIV